MADNSKQKLKIYMDEVKLRHTTHWDMDAMSRAELEDYMQGKSVRSKSGPDNRNAGSACDHRPEARKAAGAWSRFMQTLQSFR